MQTTTMIAWIPLFPLLGFLVNGLWYGLVQTRPGSKKAGSLVPGLIAAGAVGASFVVSLMLFLQLLSLPEEGRVLEQILGSWIQVGSFNLDLGFRIDSLSTLFTLVITGVGTLIHIYSIGYMSHDESPTKFFAYLNLFCFAMLVLVTGSSLPMLFFGWEGVGLCSYLLIGYWYADSEKASAGKKAFIVNRVGDLGFLLGMFLIYTTFGTLDFVALKDATVATGAMIVPGVITAIGLLLFVGCMGKSAQIPLYVWLPDAMAGPTPVSALIHAATMVTSGIYMVTRLNFIYTLSDVAMMTIAVVGAVTAFFAATIAVVQTDIKKVLAYSTVSQLGYMFLGCGVGAFGAGVFHVITHAFFKALLFLGAGSVIHGMHEEQNIMKMGGLKKAMPYTYGVFLIGWLAICGIPPFSGFFSKDEILWMTFSSAHGSWVLWALAAMTAVMTAFYMTRLFVLTFEGKPRHVSHGQDKHSKDAHGHGSGGVHESPMVMVIPLMILAVLSAVGGLMGVPHFNWLAHWLHPVIGAHGEPQVPAYLEWVFMALSVMGAGLGIWFARRLYSNLTQVEQLKKRWQSIHQLLTNKWYVDEVYEAVIVRPIHFFSEILWKVVDVRLIDQFVLAFGRVSSWTGQTLRVLQVGTVQAYAIMVVLGLLVAVGYIIYGLV